jgi:hypothetical protein
MYRFAISNYHVQSYFFYRCKMIKIINSYDLDHKRNKEPTVFWGVDH